MTKLSESNMSHLREELLEVLIDDFLASGYSYRDYASKLVDMPHTSLSNLVNRKRIASFDLLLPALTKRGLISIEELTTTLLSRKNASIIFQNTESSHSQPLNPSLEPKVVKIKNLKNGPHNAPKPSHYKSYKRKGPLT